MSTKLATAIDGLDSVLFETGLVLHQVTQGSPKSAAAVERVLGLVAADVQQRVLEIARLSPTAQSVRRLRERRATLGALEFAVRRAAQEMTATLGQILPTQSSGAYSPDPLRVSTAGAWMNVRSSP